MWPKTLSFALIAVIVSSGLMLSVSDIGPQPPCESDVYPAYPDVDKPPATKFWNQSSLGRDWRPPACTGWRTNGFETMVVTAGRFRSSSGSDGIRRRIGAISELKGLLYWSTSHQAWQTLIVDAYAASEPTKGQHRTDFSPEEISEGKILYYQQTDNLSGKALYRMHIITATPDQLVFDTENVSTMRYLLVPLFHPGDLQSIYFLERESKDVWRYYSIVRTGRNANRLAAGHEASSINRAVAYFRFIAGIPANMEPPAAR